MWHHHPEIYHFFLIIQNNIYLTDVFDSTIFAISFQNKGDLVYAGLYLTKLPLTKFNTTIGKTMKSVFSLLLNINIVSRGMFLMVVFYNYIIKNCITDELQNKYKSDEKELSILYENVKKEREKDLRLPEINVQHPNLRPELRPYQQDAVRWMISREQQSDRKGK